MRTNTKKPDQFDKRSGKRVLCFLLARRDCSHGASVGASTAINTNVGVDGVNIAFLDGAGRAFALASAASYAGVCRNFVCHNSVKIKSAQIYGLKFE